MPENISLFPVLDLSASQSRAFGVLELGILEKKMETTIVYRGCIGIMEKKIETTIVGMGFRFGVMPSLRCSKHPDLPMVPIHELIWGTTDVVPPRVPYNPLYV